ncbi:MAG: LCP family protein [Candidatus Magasanikbacteria bacterium]|nr:LCP family protein [Candidatus Magasanikbacteria bacterium]NCS71943.1 LCP family protein [Candidatus Magasanikbacteria bacterium]
MKRLIKITIILILFILAGWAIFHTYTWNKDIQAQKDFEKAQKDAIEAVLSTRVSSDDGQQEDIFAGKDTLNILLIGLDKRAGQEQGHCDAIQLLSIDKEHKSLTITAVPRGTYSPLPPGKGTTSSDYYVSNSCGLGGLEYGIEQIERILGQKEDHIVIVGFSEVLGLLRLADLPTTETLQWLRQRQGYAIGEPQRARNHSTFIKQMIQRFLPSDRSAVDTALMYIGYNTVHTDLSFAQVKQLVDTLIEMDVANNEDAITLAMKPAYDVQDIAYDENNINKQLGQTIGKISKWLSKEDYSNKTTEQIQQELLSIINEKEQDTEFIAWAYDNHIWLQVEDDQTRNNVQYDIMFAYANNQESPEQKQQVLADYILEMKHLDLPEWENRATDELLKELDI